MRRLRTYKTLVGGYKFSDLVISRPVHSKKTEEIQSFFCGAKEVDLTFYVPTDKQYDAIFPLHTLSCDASKTTLTSLDIQSEYHKTHLEIKGLPKTLEGLEIKNIKLKQNSLQNICRALSSCKNLRYLYLDRVGLCKNSLKFIVPITKLKREGALSIFLRGPISEEGFELFNTSLTPSKISIAGASESLPMYDQSTKAPRENSQIEQAIERLRKNSSKNIEFEW